MVHVRAAAAYTPIRDVVTMTAKVKVGWKPRVVTSQNNHTPIHAKTDSHTNRPDRIRSLSSHTDVTIIWG
jgi:hypothetical protein